MWTWLSKCVVGHSSVSDVCSIQSVWGVCIIQVVVVSYNVGECMVGSFKYVVCGGV